MINKNAGVIATVALIIAIVGVFTPFGKSVVQTVSKFGGVTNYDEVDATAIKIGGSNGSRVGPIIAGTCTVIAPNQFTSLAASTTFPFDCAITGVVAGDTVFAQFATTTGSSGGGWIIKQASASSTSGYITLRVENDTGGAAQLPGSLASTTQYLILHPVTSVPGL